MNKKDKEYYVSLINELRSLPTETEWAEFKVNNDAPDMIGEYLSAMSNSAALHEKETAYLLYGIHDVTHEIVGTSFRPRETKIGNEELENWLLYHLTPRIDFKFVEVYTEQGRVVVVEIPAARVQPTAFKGVEIIRVGSYRKKLKEFPEKERKLWRSFEIRPYETLPAKEKKWRISFVWSIFVSQGEADLTAWRKACGTGKYQLQKWRLRRIFAEPCFIGMNP